ncbi:MAG: glycoside hydrolase family 38 C-terminal domain-containing protein [Peptoniphilaceae bacterium]|nr:glycoside hydrolase family 38 C-terminal domain-containing protein [Peptoniphilaceae bacterium]MDY6019254.1 glycoside hydrolase family 38 C-terminal domain-containing protein [Anaerococcus sp.]
MKKVHIVTHTHWDREWYEPLYVHKLRLNKLIKDVIEESKNENFKHFWLDGHFIAVEDYLEINKDDEKILKDLVKREKLLIGPWYVLQDEFLTGNSSQVNNLIIGIEESEKFGKASMIGYFPDSFGNAGQMPQFMKKSGIDIIYFGRGVNTTGFNNEVSDNYSSKNSEILWQAPDGSKLVSVIFSNWYSNGNEIPLDDDKLKSYMDKRLEDANIFASTDHLLLMNGCDHQPVQKNIPEIIDKLNSMYDNYEFIHSSLNQYSKDILEAVDKDKLQVIKGELTSQMTDGRTTLINTASNRVDIKILNKIAERNLDNLTSLASMIYEKKAYPHEEFRYIYKHLLTTHPHDSICACGIDSINRGIVNRLKEVIEMVDFEIKKVLDYYKNKADFDIDGQGYFTVFNPSAYDSTNYVDLEMEFGKTYFNDFNNKKLIERLENIDINYHVEDINTEIIDKGVEFSYDIPDDAFRKPYFSRKVIYRFKLRLKGFERKTLKLNKGLLYTKEIIEGNYIENAWAKIKINDNASIDIYNKNQDKTYKNFGLVEDGLDYGTEYIFMGSEDRIYSTKLLDSKIEKIDQDYVISLFEEIEIPKEANGDLIDLQKQIIPLFDRKASRSEEKTKISIEKIFTIGEDEDIHLKVKVKNTAKDHRMRLIFANEIKTDKVYAESFFEAAKRDRYRPRTWKNPDFSNRLNRYVSISDDLDKSTFTIATLGLGEYESLEDDKIAITLFRSVREMGDWGYFETKDSQMIKDMTFDLWFNFINDREKSYKKALSQRNIFYAKQISKNVGQIKTDDVFIKTGAFLDEIHRNKQGHMIFRFYNPSDFKLDSLNKGIELAAIESKEIGPVKDEKLSNYEIRTVKL